jgi:acyl-CoA synthetase (AMP-forming)/AMP-acid ligase II
MAFPDFEPTVPAMLRALAGRYGPRELLVVGERRVRYEEAEAESALLARGLLAEGVGKGTRVGLLLPNGPEWVFAWLAAARIGALVVPLNTFSRARELRFVLRHADVDTLLTAGRFLSHDYLALLEECAPELAHGAREPLTLRELPYLRRVRVFGPCDRPWAREAPERLRRLAGGVDPALLRAVEGEVAPADLLTVVHTSGTAADPKGVVLTHGTVVRHAHNVIPVRGLRDGDRVYSGMPFFWVGGSVYSLLGAMQVGACLITQEAFEPGGALELLERERATFALGWPLFAKSMAEHPSFPARDLSRLRGGNLFQILPERLRPTDRELRHNSLGMTETCGPHTFSDMSVDLPEKLRGSFGRPVAGVEHRIVDPETGELLPPGAEGEICVRGYSLMQGLYKVEREDTFEPDGFYRTGDLGRFDAEGHLFFLGRGGEMIKSGGANVAPREIEVVLESFPEVQYAFALGLPDPASGQVIAAAVALHDGQRAAPEELRARLRRELSSYKVPRHLFVMDAAELPFLDTGKIDRRRLRERLAARVARADGPAGPGG